VQISGSIDFGLGLTFTRTPTNEKIMWRLDLTRSPTSTVSGFKCTGSDKCEKIKTYLETEFKSMVVTFVGEHPYSQPTSTRQALGMIGYINDFSEREIETTHM